MTDKNKNEAAQDDNNSQFVVQRIYIKNLSFETTNTPTIFQEKWEPELNLDLNTAYTTLDNNVFEVTLTVTATVTNNKKTAFLVEVQQAGIFTIQGPSDEQIDHLLNSFCPSLLFPYAREVISSEVSRGSFPQLILAPVNFDSLYIQQLEKLKEKSQETEH
ncbi:MAG: protein-export chaperone SecB [Legionellales bacterium RIFCSPHIGHO2_12_FULL_35_11]|nr:MAG: protein-export chaperone SecB [Legionellales bacterium RIFCSPHIGHO2_12_FULL_35_11]